jgi:hypothetical protein
MSIRHRSGLHREISSIFDGVPLPKKNDTADAPGIAPAATDRTAGRVPPPPSAAPKPSQINAPTQQPKVNPPHAVEAVKQPKQPNKFRAKAKDLFDKAKTKILTPPEGVSRRKQTAMVISIPIMFVIVLFVFGRLFLNSGVRGVKNSDIDDFAALSAPKTQIDWQKPALYPQDLRDPMKEVIVSSPTAPSQDLVVRGIVWSDDNPAAVIGTAIVYRGQTVNGATVVQISRKGVEFEKDGKKWTQTVQN